MILRSLLFFVVLLCAGTAHAECHIEQQGGVTAFVDCDSWFNPPKYDLRVLEDPYTDIDIDRAMAICRDKFWVPNDHQPPRCYIRGTVADCGHFRSPCDAVERKWREDGGPEREAAAAKAKDDADRALIERMAK